MLRGALLAATLIAAGCGFHLVGADPAPALQSVAVRYEQSDRVVPPPLIDALRARLDNSQAGENAGVLTIQSIHTTRRVLAISPRDGNAVAYELVSTAVFDFRAHGKTLLQDQSLSVRRAYSFDPGRRLAAEAQRRTLLANMQQALADHILLRLHGALSQ
ncbi:MAG: hypothetical protein L0H19_01060 [Salinisphaera sp.]|nr:hypothetical protein [Salinisphaera sp.]